MLSVLFAAALIKLIIFFSCRQTEIIDGQNVLRCSPSYRKGVLAGVYIFPLFVAIFIGTIAGFKSTGLGWGYFAFSFPIAGYYIYLTKYYLFINEIGIKWQEFNKVRHITFSEVTNIHTSILKEEKSQSYSKITVQVSKKHQFKLEENEYLDFTALPVTQFKNFDDLVIKILRNCEPYHVQVSKYYWTPSND